MCKACSAVFLPFLSYSLSGCSDNSLNEAAQNAARAAERARNAAKASVKQAAVDVSRWSLQQTEDRMAGTQSSSVLYSGRHRNGAFEVTLTCQAIEEETTSYSNGRNIDVAVVTVRPQISVTVYDGNLASTDYYFWGMWHTSSLVRMRIGNRELWEGVLMRDKQFGNLWHLGGVWNGYGGSKISPFEEGTSSLKETADYADVDMGQLLKFELTFDDGEKTIVEGDATVQSFFQSQCIAPVEVSRRKLELQL